MSLTEIAEVSLIAPDHLFIGGEWVKPSTSDQIDVINSSTEEVFFRVAEANAEDMDRAIAAAREAFDRGPWPRLTHGERAEYLVKIASALEERAPEIGSIWSGQAATHTSLPPASGPGHGRPFRYYAGLADEFPFEERHTPTAGGNVGLLVREAVGVVGAIIPWNGPMGLIGAKVAPALLAGCTVILKASPEAPGEASVFAEVAQPIGPSRSCWCVILAWTRSASRARLRPVAALPPSAGSASPELPSSSAGSRPQWSWTTSISPLRRRQSPGVPV
jgi:aldehyde dehydrogenase (NAD+)